jgi:exodeoxyribonuclease VII small subunit
MGKGKILIGRPGGDSFVQMSGKKKELSFEEALENLEELVASMESGDIPLAGLVEKFEEGSKLVKTCEERLKKAELRIEKLRQENDDSVELESFSPESE